MSNRQCHQKGRHTRSDRESDGPVSGDSARLTVLVDLDRHHVIVSVDDGPMPAYGIVGAQPLAVTWLRSAARRQAVDMETQKLMACFRSRYGLMRTQLPKGGFAPEWTAELPDRDIVLKKVRGIDFKIGLGVAWNKEDPTAARDDIIDIARSLARPGR